MKLTFWGVRGSIPTPLNQEQLRSRIAAAIMRVQPSDLRTPETREAFLASLPPYLYGTVGGNTACIEIRSRRGKQIIFDAGSGIRELSASLIRRQEGIKEFHLFFTHFHWDHLQGLPFFTQAYIKGNRLNFYSPQENLERILRGQMKEPYFPVEMDVMAAEKRFVRLDRAPVKMGGMEISWKRMKHPGSCYAYRVRENGKIIIFSTDAEITAEDFRKEEENRSFFQGADILILDSQYTLGEAIEKYNWGHTSYSMAVDFAAEWNIRTLVLFHHEPMYTDRKVFGILNSAEWYRQRLENRSFQVILAKEGLELEL